jgi:hypothetical protein
MRVLAGTALTESNMPQVVDFFSSSHTMQRFYLVPGLDP